MVRRLTYGSPSKYGKYVNAASRLAQKYVTPKNVMRVTKAIYDKVRKTPQKPKSNFRVFKKQDRSTQTKRGTARQFGGHSTGVYGGKFKKTHKIKRTIEQMCLSKGAHCTMEQYGTFSDPNVVYIHHSTSYFDEIAKVMNAALLRKVLNKSGFKITNSFNELAVTNPVAGVGAIEDSSGLKFVLTNRNPITGEHINFTYDTVNNQTFKDITEVWNDLKFRIIDYMRGDSKDELYKLAIYRKDEFSFGTQWRLGAEIFLEDISVELHFTSTLVLQNRTKAANVTSDDGNMIERVDSQPLKGICYDFKHADPRVRHTGGISSPFNDNTNILFNTTTEQVYH